MNVFGAARPHVGALTPNRLLVALLLLAACSGGADDVARAEPSTASSTTVAPEREPPFAVGRRDFQVVDDARGRTIDVILLYPATGAPGPAPHVARVWDHGGADDGERVATVDAPPEDGPFPLVVFGHGWAGQGSSFVPAGEQWARAGYVVALPTFPYSRNGIANADDYVNQPGDLSFVIDELSDEPFVNTEHLAIGGHSLGSSTVFRGAYNACCIDPRVDATIAVSGGPIDIGEPGYAEQPDTPMLLVHGAQDPGVPVAISDAMFDFVTAPVTYVRLANADHTSVFTGDNGEIFSAAALAFLDANLRDDPDALAELPSVVAASGLAELRSR